jgi:hypothetical protein
MSYLWSFYSYDPVEYQRYLTGQGALSQENALALLDWDAEAFGGSDAVEWLASHLSLSGLSYEGLVDIAPGQLDAVVPALFSPEGLERELAVEPESPEGVHSSAFSELVARCASTDRPARLLTILARGGRRANGEEPQAACEYCLLSPDEVKTMLGEVDVAFSVDTPWSAAYQPQLVDECLRQVLRRVVAKGKALAALLG